MTDPLLPPGIKVGAAIGEDERSKARLDIEADLSDGQKVTATIVFAETRQARALGALLIKQADLIDAAEQGRGQPSLQLVGGSEA
jgi:hypothetical protein